MNKADKILLGLIIFFSLLSFSVITLITNNKSKGTVAIIKVDGKIVNTINMKNIKESTYEIQGTIGTVYIEVTSKGIHVVDAPCKDKICVHRGYILKSQESVVCLPSKVSIELTGDNSEIDATTQ